MDALVDRAVQGDKAAFGEIYRHMFGPVAKYLYYRLGEESEAEAMANEVFTSAYRSLPRYKGGYFPGFVFRIAKNASIGALRKRRPNHVDLDSASQLPSTIPGPHEMAERAAAHRLLYEALSQLKAEQRDVVVMKHLLGMSNTEVSRALGKSENAVNAQNNRAMKSLKRLLDEVGL